MIDLKNIPDYLNTDELDQVELSNILSGMSVDENLDDNGNQIIDMNTDNTTNNITVLTQNITKFSSDKIEQNYDTSFSELLNENEMEENIMIEEDIKQLSEDQLKRESVLENQLDELSKVLERESQRNVKIQEDAESNYKAMKAVIIDQRISAGEGKEESDFQDSFPFLPKNSSSNTDTTFNPSPYAIDPN
tara:strand:+ start:137 stop:709 length:573 start_codon:yes stop_codon:yes gene_type:complete